MAQKVKITAYMRNVGRSFGYVVKDVVGDYAPTMKSILSETKSTYQDIKFSMQEMKTRNISNSFNSSPNILTNTLDDLKSGKWYNKEREDDAFGFDFDIGDFGSDEDWGDDSDNDDSSDIITNDNMNTREVISSMGQVSRDISKSVGYATARSAEYIVANNNASSKALYNLNAKGFNQVSSILLNMSDTMVGLASLGEPLSAHMQNSSVFYTKTTETLNTMNENLSILVKRTEYMENMASKNAKSAKNGYDRFMSGDKFDFGSYIDMVKENVKDQSDTIKSMYEMMEMMFGKNGKNTSLTQLLLKGGANVLIPQITKDMAKQFDEALSNALSNGLMRAGKIGRSKGGIIGILSDILFPKENIKTTINTANYEKGPMQWDGIARQSLTYVIPTYLANISSMLAGVNDADDYQYYDFARGKFTTKRINRREKEDRYRQQARRVGGDFRDIARGKANGNRQIEDEIDEYIYQAIQNGGNFYDIRKGKNDANWRKKYGNISDETLDILIQILDESRKSNYKYKNAASNFERDTNSAISENTRRMNEEELSGMSFEAHYNDGYTSYINNRSYGRGKKGRSISRNTSEKQTINHQGSSNKYRENSDGTYTVGNNIILNSKDFDQWFKALESNDEDLMRKIEQTKAMQDAKDKIKNMKSGVKDFTGGLLKSNNSEAEPKKNGFLDAMGKVKDIIQAPAYAVTMAMDTLTSGLNQLFWGDHGDGLIDSFKNKLKNAWDSIDKALGISDAFKNGKKRVAINAMGDRLPPNTVDVRFKTLPSGRDIYYAVTSEGEKVLLKDASLVEDWQKRMKSRKTLKQAMSDEWYNITTKAKSAISSKFKQFTESYKQSSESYKESSGFEASGSGLLISGGDSNIGKVKKKAKGKAEEAKDSIAKGAESISSGINRFVSETLYGKNPDEEKKKAFDALKANSKKAFGDMGEAKGAMGIGALAGAGVSLLTGAIVGPIAGAGIGAAVGLATKSKAFQDFLFGEGDPNSKDYKKGLLGNFGKKLKNKDNQDILKSAGIGGGIGLVGGTLMGSPILGMMLGTTVGYVHKSKAAQEWLFGKEDNPNELGKLKNNIKKKFPSIAAGAAAGMLFGPFGMVGNIMLGGALGYLSSGEKFRKFLFGDESATDKNSDEAKGLTGRLHDKVIKPLDDIMHNISNGISGFLRKIGANIKDKLKSLADGAKEKINKSIEKIPWLDSAKEKITKAGKAIIRTPLNLVGGALDAINTGTKKINLDKGYGVYDSRLKRNATAEERLNMRTVIANGGAIKDKDGKFYKVNVNGTRHEIDEAEYNDILQKQASKGKVWHGNKQSTKIDEAISKMSKEDIESFKDLDNDGINAKLSKLTRENVKMSAGDIANFKNLLETEKSTRFSPEKMAEEQQKDEEDYKTNILGVLHNIDYHFNKKKFFKLRGKYKVVSAVNIPETPEIPTNGDADSRTEFTANGPVQYIKNSQGEWVTDDADMETKETMKKQNTFNESINSIGKVGGLLGGISGFLGAIKTGLLGDKEGKKEGILSKLFSGLFGEEGAFTGILSFFTGETGSTKNIIKSILGKGGKSGIKTALGTAMTEIVGPALLFAGLGGKFDEVASDLTDDAFNETSSSDSTVYEVTTKSGETVSATKDENGNYIDENGNIIDVKSVNSASKGRQSFSDKLKYNTVRNTLTGTKSVASTVLGRTTAGKGISNFISNASKVVASSTDDSIEAMATRLAFTDDVAEGIAKFCTKLKKIPMLKNVDLDGMAAKLSAKVTNSLSSTTAKNIANFASNAVVWLKIAFIVADFTTGYEDARTTLGIVKEPTVGQRILSGLLRAIKNFIPIIGTLIPDSLVIDVFCDYIAPALGIDAEELKNDREEAQNTVDQYNATNGTDYSVGDFNKQVLKDYTWTERIGNSVKSTWEDTKTKASNFSSSVKENGLVNTFKNMAGDAITTFKDSYSKNGGGISGIISGIGDSFGNLLPGVLGEIVQKNAEIKSLATKGELKALWKVSLDDFSGGGEAVEGTNLTTAVPSIFSKAIGQIPLLLTKLVATPISLVAIVGKKVGSVISGIVDKIKTNVTAIQSSFSTGAEMLAQKGGEFSFSEFMDVSEITEDGDNPLGGITKSICKVSRFISLPVMLLKAVGVKISNSFNKVIDKVKNTAGNIASNYIALTQYQQNGDISGLWSNDIEDDEGNPLGGFYKAINFGQKISLSIPTLFKAVGNKISSVFSPIKDKITNTASNIATNYLTMQEKAKAGDISGLWSNDIEDDEGNPLGGFYKAINFTQKLSSTPMALFKAAGNKIIEILHVSDIKSDASLFNSTLNKMKNYASEGDLSSIWSTEASFSEDDPVKVFYNIGLTFNKIGQSFIAIINKILNPIKEAVGTVKDTISNAASNIWNGITGWISDTVSGGSSGFVSQYDPQYQKYSVSGQNFAAKGCGPAVASMAASAFGKHLSVGDAVRASSGYQNAGGVTLDYFQNALGSRGINTQIISGGSSADMYSKIASGQKMILLGQDSYNTSKANSPFGPNNHYVLATGVDRRGNVIVNDPEARGPRAYSPAILANAKYGIAGSASGLSNRISKMYHLVSGGATGVRNDEITQQIWAYLTTKLGMSEAAAAGVMGNMQQESGCLPNVNQTSGSAYGLCQWDGDRKTKLMKIANYQNLSVQLDYLASELPYQYWSKSGTINDIDGANYSYSSMTYDQFKQMSDVAQATIKFEAAFERAGKPAMSKRLTYAKGYYELFTGKTYTIDSSIGTSSASSVTTGSTDSSSSNSIFSIISTITSAFSNAFSGLTGNNSSSSSTDSTGTSTGTTSNPVDPNFTSKSPVEWMKSILGKISYSQSGPRDPEKGSADCSSTVRWAIKKAGGPDIGSNTANQLDSDKLNVVWDGNGNYATSAIQNSMKENDVIFFSRPTSSFTAGRKYRVGHVGLYEGNGKYIDHGSGMGPKEKTLSFGSDGKIVRVSRINTSAAGSGLMSYEDLANVSGGSSGLLIRSRAGSAINRGIAIRDPRSGRLVPINISGGASDISGITTSMLNSVSSTTINKAKSGSVSSELVAQLLQSITTLLNNIANNTAPVDKIYKALAAYISAGGNVSGGGTAMDKVTVKKNNSTQSSSSASSEIDSNISTLVGVLAELAKG